MKRRVAEINVIAGLSVEGAAHQGVTVKHRSRVALDPTHLNLRQVHLIHSELFHELRDKAFEVDPAELSENVTTVGIDLLSLPRKTLITIGPDVVLEVTGLRNPCAQIERFQPGLLAAVLDRGPNGEVFRKAGIITVARAGGVIRPGDRIEGDLPTNHPTCRMNAYRRQIGIESTTTRNFKHSTEWPRMGRFPPDRFFATASNAQVQANEDAIKVRSRLSAYAM